MGIIILAGTLLMPNSGNHVPLKPWPPPPPEHIPIFVTGYNWNLGGINCGGDGCGHTAIGFPTSDDLLGKVAACPIEWLGMDITRYISIDGVGGFWCIDTFGSEEHRYERWIPGIGWVYHIDLALEDPWSAPYGLHYNYSLHWSYVYNVGCYECVN